MKLSEMSLKMKISTSAMLICCELMILLTLLIGTNLNQILASWGGENQLTVYMKSEISPEQIDLLSSKLKSETSVGTVRHITPDQAAEEFNKDTSTFGKGIVRDIPLKEILTDSLEVSLKKELSIESQIQALGSLTAKFKDFDGIESLSYGQEWVEKFSSFVATAKSIGGIGILTILMLCGFLLNTTMKTLVMQKKKEIEILEMVGASKSFIRKPFLRTAISLAAISSSLAVGILLLLFLGLRDGFSSQIAAYGLTGVISFLSVTEIVGFVIVTIFFCVIAAYLALRQANRGGYLNA